MRKNILCYLPYLVLFLAFFALSIRAQKDSRINVTGEIVAYDRLSSLLNITSAIEPYTFVLKIDSRKKPDPNQPYIIVIYETLGTWTFQDILGNGDSRVKLKLNREKTCDSDVSELEVIKLPKSTANKESIARLEWLTKDKPSPTTKLPCYKVRGRINVLKS